MWAMPTCGCGPISPEDVRALGGYPEIPIYCYYCGLPYIFTATSSAQAVAAGWHLEEELNAHWFVIFP